MKLEWMGEYRDVVEAIIGVANIYNQIYNYKVFSDPSGKILLTANEVQIIEYIYENEERNDNMSEVARRLSISQSTFSKKVKQLVQKGLLERNPDQKDRRKVHLILTEDAQPIMYDVQQVQESYAAQLLDGFSEEEYETYIHLKGRILENVKIGEERGYDHE